MTPDTEQLARLADEATSLLKAFAHPARLLICCQLKDEELSVSQIEERLGIKQPRLSRELAKLREEGLVETRREAKMVFYRLSSSHRVRGMMDSICAVMLGRETSVQTFQEPADRRKNRAGGYGVFPRIRTS